MPTLRHLAAEGTAFTRAIAHSNWTPLSFPSVLGPKPVFVGSSDHELQSPTLAEALSAAGVETVGLNAANGFLTDYWGYDRGFDRFESFVKTSGRVNRWLASHPTTHGWVQLLESGLHRPFRRSDPRHVVDTSKLLDIEDRLLAELDTDRDRQFIWAHLMDTHTPYVPAPRYLDGTGSWDRVTRLVQQANASLGNLLGSRDVSQLHDRYRATARQVDASLARIRDALDDRGIAEETCVIVAGDHGEEFLEHGHTAHYPKLYTELVDVPLVIDHPAGTPARVEQPVGLDSVPATILDLFGADTSAFEGPSLGPTVTDGVTPTAAPVVSATVRGDSVTAQPIPRSPADGSLIVSVRDDRWTYIYHAGTGQRELYDRPTDPGEHQSVIDDHEGSAAVTRLHERARDHIERVRGDGDAGADGQTAPPESVQDRLEHLGYA